jgi:hypothetical protein
MQKQYEKVQKELDHIKEKMRLEAKDCELKNKIIIYENDNATQKIGQLTSSNTRLEHLLNETKILKEAEFEELIKKNLEQLDSIKQIHKREII